MQPHPAQQGCAASAGGGGARRGLTPRPRAWRVCHKTASTTCSLVPRHCLSPGLFPGHPNHPTGSLLLPDTFRKPGSNCICTCSSSPAAPHSSLKPRLGAPGLWRAWPPPHLLPPLPCLLPWAKQGHRHFLSFMVLLPRFFLPCSPEEHSPQKDSFSTGVDTVAVRY